MIRKTYVNNSIFFKKSKEFKKIKGVMNTKFSMMVTSQEGEQWRGRGLLQKMMIHIYLHYKYKYMHAVLSITKKYIFIRLEINGKI